MGVFRRPIGDFKSTGSSGDRKQRMRELLNKALRYAVIAFGVGGLLFVIMVVQIATQLPDVDIISTYVPNETTKVFARDGALLAELHKEENRAVVPISKISDFVKASVIASEDSNFFYHHGVDFKGIIRSAFTNLLFGSALQGGSTITQQLARNVFLSKKKNIIRKLAEIVLAIQIERRYTKEEILEFYLNQVYWGHNAYGIESASNLFFAKHANELTLAESALLIGMLRGPELYSPFVNPRKARWRQEIVLKRLLVLGLINEEEYYNAKEQPIFLAQRKKLKYKAPYFTSYVVKQLESMYGEDVVYSSGLKVYTTLDTELQKKAEDVVEYYMVEASRPHWIKGQEVSSLNCTQGALLSIDPKTGYIISWVGGRDFLEREFDHIVQAKRQPGSSFKPYTYLTALSMGISPGTVIDDVPVTFNTIQGPYAPKNYTKDFKGAVTVRRALELSLNIPAIKISDMIDPSNIIVTCRKLGVQGYLAPVLSLTLGSSELTILEHSSAYSVFANGGVRVDPVSILRIEDRNGNVLYRHEIVEKRVFNANRVYALVNILKGVPIRGTGQGAAIAGYDIAGKTGTTNDYRDAWFIGFTPNLLTTCWVGNDDNSTMKEVTGGWLPAQMWKSYMTTALTRFPKEYFPFPRGMVRQKICLDGKALATVYCPSERVVEDVMWEESAYTESCGVHGVLSGISNSAQGTRADWEKTFYPDASKVKHLKDVGIQPEQQTAAPKPAAAQVKKKVDLNRGI